MQFSSLQFKMLATLAGIAVLVLGISMFTVANNEKALVNELLESQIREKADTYFDALNTMMLTGTIANRQTLQNKMLSHEMVGEARIVRAPAVVKLFGSGNPDQKAMDELDRQALQGEEVLAYRKDKGEQLLTYIKPIRASENFRGTNCLGCHQVKEGELMGAVRISYKIDDINASVTKNIWLTGLIEVAVFVIGIGGFALIMQRRLFKRLKHIRDDFSNIATNTDLTHDLANGSKDEIGQLAHSFNHMLTKFRGSLKEVLTTSEQVERGATELAALAENTRQSVLSQRQGTDVVASAMTEMEASATEVKASTDNAKNQSNQADELAQQGASMAIEAVSSIEVLSDQVSNASEVIMNLDEQTQEVGKVLEVIKGIAEQTNLLALNAAIEAARAGEMGRGFAVVADEVRSLATRTHESTEEIQHTIEALQQQVHGAVESMNTAKSSALEQAAVVSNVAGRLQDIAGHVGGISEINEQVAVAAMQQSAAAEEINRNLQEITEMASTSADNADQSTQLSEQLSDLSVELLGSVNKFKT